MPGAEMARPKKLTDNDLWRIHKLMLEGRRDDELALECGVSETTIRNLRDSWGISRPPRKRRFDASDNPESTQRINLRRVRAQQRALLIKALRMAGYAPKEISFRSGLNTCTVYKRCQEFGLGKSNVKLTDAVRSEIIRRWKAGEKNRKIAFDLDLSEGSVSIFLNEFKRELRQ